MLKRIDDIRKSARERASRRWHNHQVERNFKAAQKEESHNAASRPKEIEPADTIENDKVRAGSLTRTQTKFAKELKAMLEGHNQRNVKYYLASLEAKRQRCLQEKLRRLQAAQSGE